MKHILFLLLVLCMTNVQAVLITSENFESGATGWNNNTTTNGGTNFTTFLGRYGGTSGTQVLYKTYTPVTAMKDITIQFDFYGVDSWDGEHMKLYINDVVVQSVSLGVGISLPSNIVSLNSGSLGFNASYQDRLYRVTWEITNVNISTLKLGFGTTLDQAIDDESWGVDNVIINATYIPEPNTILLGILTMLAAFVYTKRKN